MRIIACEQSQRGVVTQKIVACILLVQHLEIVLCELNIKFAQTTNFCEFKLLVFTIMSTTTEIGPAKYPKTCHLPFSPQVNDDDEVMDVKLCGSLFSNKEVIITEKMDGGNCQLFRGKVYARTNTKEATQYAKTKQVTLC